MQSFIGSRNKAARKTIGGCTQYFPMQAPILRASARNVPRPDHYLSRDKSRQHRRNSGAGHVKNRSPSLLPRRLPLARRVPEAGEIGRSKPPFTLPPDHMNTGISDSRLVRRSPPSRQAMHRPQRRREDRGQARQEPSASAANCRLRYMWGARPRPVGREPARGPTKCLLTYSDSRKTYIERPMIVSGVR